MKHYVVLTRFSYSEPGYSSASIIPFEADCEPEDLPNAYRAFIRAHVADEAGNERHYGHKTVIGAFEAVAIPVHALDAAIKGAHADVKAAESAEEQAEEERTRAEDAASTELREREELARLFAKYMC